MDEHTVREILHRLTYQELSLDDAVATLQTMTIGNLGHTRLDHAREARCGAEEVIFAAGKRIEQLSEIVAAQRARNGRVLVSRVTDAQRGGLSAHVPDLEFSLSGNTAWIGAVPVPMRMGPLGVLTAGTSDGAVAEEVECTARYFGCDVRRINDVGVAGLHRLVDALPAVAQCQTLVVVAGMDGALASVVSGLVAVPVVAVPTSVGYGAAFNGLAALLSMLVSCAPGISVVNIDNGFGAAMVALRILQQIVPLRATKDEPQMHAKFLAKSNPSLPLPPLP